MGRDGFTSLEGSRKTRSYIPSKCGDNQCLKISIIVGSLVMLTLITAAIAGAFNPKNNGSDTNPNIPFDHSMQLILSGNNRIYYFNTDNQTVHYNESVQINGTIDSFEFDGTHNKIWWNEAKAAILYSFENRTSSNNSILRYGRLFYSPQLKVQDMAYDHIGDNLYVIDKSAETLIVINVASKNYTVLLTNLYNPHHIQLDPERGLMFILQESISILRGNMDGSNMQRIVDHGSMSAMTVDSRTQRIYWALPGNGIYSSDYEGKNWDVFPLDAMNIVDMAVVNDVIYWLWEEHGDDKTSHRLVSCKIENGACGEHTVRDFEQLGDFGSIKATPMHSKWNPSIKNQCSKENSGCDHFCLISSDGKPSCACQLGWQLDLNKKSCRQTKEFVLYTTSNFGEFDYARGHVLDSARNFSVDTILPTPYKVNDNEKFSLDYDMTNDILYFSDEKNIYTMRLRSNWTGQSVILKGDNETHIKGITYDWLTGDLYYLESNNKNGSKINVFDVKLGSKSRKTLIRHEKLEAKSLRIHPKLGRLVYYTMASAQSKKGAVHIVTTNGTEIKQIPDVDNASSQIEPIGIDYEDNRIYWADHGKVSSSNFDGTDIKTVVVSEGLYYPQGISVHGKWMYIQLSHGILRVDKTSGFFNIKLLPNLNNHLSKEIRAMKICSESILKE